MACHIASKSVAPPRGGVAPICRDAVSASAVPRNARRFTRWPPSGHALLDLREPVLEHVFGHITRSDQIDLRSVQDAERREIRPRRSSGCARIPRASSARIAFRIEAHAKRVALEAVHSPAMSAKHRVVASRRGHREERRLYRLQVSRALSRIHGARVDHGAAGGLGVVDEARALERGRGERQPARVATWCQCSRSIARNSAVVGSRLNGRSPPITTSTGRPDGGRAASRAPARSHSTSAHRVGDVDETHLQD